MEGSIPLVGTAVTISPSNSLRNDNNKLLLVLKTKPLRIGLLTERVQIHPRYEHNSYFGGNVSGCRMQDVCRVFVVGSGGGTEVHVVVVVSVGWLTSTAQKPVI